LVIKKNRDHKEGYKQDEDDGYLQILLATFKTDAYFDGCYLKKSNAKLEML